jgi:PAS domain-containing protein
MYYSLHPEAREMARHEVMDFVAVLSAANDPAWTSDCSSPWTPNQEFRRRDGIVTVCNRVTREVLGVYPDDLSWRGLHWTRPGVSA